MITVEQRGSLYRWACSECGKRGRRWYLTPAEAKDAGLEHVEAQHPDSLKGNS